MRYLACRCATLTRFRRLQKLDLAMTGMSVVDECLCTLTALEELVNAVV